MPITLSLTIIILCIVGEAFFSGSEIALVSVDRLKLKHAAKSGHKSSQLVLNLLENPERILATTLFGTNIFVITSTTVAASLFYNLMGQIGIPLSIVVMSFVNWIFAEIVPKSVFQQLSNSITPKIAYFIKLLSLLFFPVTWTFTKISAGINQIISGKKKYSHEQIIGKEEMKLMMEMTRSKTDIKPSERKMINRMLNFSEIEISEIMMPLIEVSALSDKTTIDKAIEQFRQTKHRRLPIFHNRIDRITGILNSFDILGEKGNSSIKPFIREAYYVPHTKKASVLLEELQHNGINMAFVVDEFGGTEGIVTIEDILEEVVGEIEDEYDKFKPAYQIHKDGTIIAKGRMVIDELNDLFKLNIPPGDYETVSGFIINQLDRIPKAGETVKITGSTLIVHRASSKMVIEVKILTIPKKK